MEDKTIFEKSPKANIEEIRRKFKEEINFTLAALAEVKAVMERGLYHEGLLGREGLNDLLYRLEGSSQAVHRHVCRMHILSSRYYRIQDLLEDKTEEDEDQLESGD